jgi:hypothetical protein
MIPAEPSFIDNLISFPLTVSLTIFLLLGERLIGNFTWNGLQFTVPSGYNKGKIREAKEMRNIRLCGEQ